MVAASSLAGDSRPQVFINYRKEELRKTFINSLLPALKRSNINYFIDDNMKKGKPISDLFKKIEESPIALVIFSKRYSESKWCLDELQKIKERAEEDLIVVFPVFVNVTPSQVKNFQGVFGEKFKEMRNKHGEEKVQKWKEAVEYIAGISGVVWNDRFTGTYPCDFSDEFLASSAATEVKKELLRRDPNYGKTKDYGIGDSLAASAIIALFCGIVVPQLFLADGNLRSIASWLIGLLVFYIGFHIKPRNVTTPASPSP